MSCRAIGVVSCIVAVGWTGVAVSARAQPSPEMMAEKIAKHRQGDAELRITGENGTPLAGAEIEARQLGHEFLFGCCLKTFPERRMAGRATYLETFAGLFNYATTENAFKWAPFEPLRGQPHYKTTDQMAAWCIGNGITLKGHTLVWGARQGRPSWLPWEDTEEMGRLVEARVRTVVARYKGRVDIWDVVNEPVHTRQFEQVFPDYVARAYRWAREENPDAVLVINDYDIIGGGSSDEFFDLVKELIDQGVPIDAIGLQAHPGTVWLSPRQVYDALDKFSVFGKEIHITEYTVPVDGSRIRGGYRKGRWSEQAQAEYYREFYTTCFSHPAVSAITCWGHYRTWQKQGGLLRDDFTPKPAFHTLENLIHDTWRTRVSGKTDSEGRFAFRGFYGRYDVSAQLPDGTVKRWQFDLKKGVRNVAGLQ